MIANRATEFYVNGHQCLVKYKCREHYTGWINGEKVDTGHSVYGVRERLINEAKWRVETEPDFWKICRAVDNFVESQKDRDGNYVWVYTDFVVSQVTPMETVGPAYGALLELENLGILEKDKICIESNVGEMWRAKGDVEEDIDDSIQDPWEKYEE